MPLTGFIRKQLMGLAAAGLICVVVLLVHYLETPKSMGVGTYEVRAEFASGAGLYDGAEVTYLGNPVGKVKDMSLSKQGIEVTLRLDDDVAIPSDVTAQVHSRSAVGEQYVDLSNGGEAGEDLSGGSSIPTARTKVSVQVGPLLDNVGQLLDSVPERRLRTVISEASEAFEGRAEDLGDLLDEGSELLDGAEENLEPTKRLLRDSQPLLRAVNTSAPAIERLTGNLDRVSRTLRKGDGELRELLKVGPGASRTTAAFVRRVDPLLEEMLPRTLHVARILETYRGGLAQVLTDLPRAVRLNQSAAGENADMNYARFTLSNINTPAPCYDGYLPLKSRRPPRDVDVIEDTPMLFCAAPPKDPRVVKGARNVPCVTRPEQRAATAERCPSTE